MKKSEHVGEDLERVAKKCEHAGRLCESSEEERACGKT